MKKFLALLCGLIMCSSLFAACGKDNSPPDGDLGQTGQGGQQTPEEQTPEQQTPEEQTPEQPKYEEGLLTNLSADGYVRGKIGDFSQYEGTSAYRKVSTADEFISAIADAKCHYVNTWNEETSTYTQTPAEGYTEENYKGTVRVIEILNDINLGYNKLSAAAKASGLVDDFSQNKKPNVYMSDMYTENGISQIKIENTSDLLVFSNNGAKLTHCGFKLTSDSNIAIRNLSFDEIWQWEDTADTSLKGIGDYDAFGWAYFKIAFCGYVWIDHCSFGKSYDGQIDYSNPVYAANAGVAFRAPLGADGGNGLHISWCSFNAGSDDKDGYLYKMMAKMEEEYSEAKAGGTSTGHLYYDALRDKGASFEDILYGLAIPQKKGFLCGDNAKYEAATHPNNDYGYNLSLQVSFANCKFTNLEDRLPKLRGGNAYMYNCSVDSLTYYGYRAKLRGVGAASAVTAVNSKWKCALASQGLVCGNGGSVKAENCKFAGIADLLKNNDTNNSGEYAKGGYMLVNCSYQKGESDAPYIGSSSDKDCKFTNASPSNLSTENFSFHTKDGAAPFSPALFTPDKLDENLSDSQTGAGIKDGFPLDFLKSVYTNN